MKIGFLVNDVKTEKAGYTTIRLACEALNLGHEVCMFGVGDVAYDADETVRARAKMLPRKSYGSHESFFKDLQFLLIGPAWLMSWLYKKLGIQF